MFKIIAVVAVTLLAVAMLRRKIPRNLSQKHGGCGDDGGCGCNSSCTSCTCGGGAETAHSQEYSE